MPEKQNIKTFLQYQFPAIGWALFLFVMSSLPDLPGPKLGIDFEDKLQHLIAYSILGFLIARAFFYQNRYANWKKNFLWMAIIIGIFYGIMDEFHQYFVPGRFTDILDALADSIGTILGALLFRYRLRLKQRISISK